MAAGRAVGRSWASCTRTSEAARSSACSDHAPPDARPQGREHRASRKPAPSRVPEPSRHRHGLGRRCRSSWPPPTCCWRNNRRFVLTDGRNRCLASLILALEYLLVAWLVPSRVERAFTRPAPTISDGENSFPGMFRSTICGYTRFEEARLTPLKDWGVCPESAHSDGSGACGRHVVLPAHHLFLAADSVEHERRLDAVVAECLA
jgi:hypothetical protein